MNKKRMNLIKSEKGSTTSIVMITIFFLVVVLMGSFVMNSIIQRSQIQQTDEIRKTYQEDVDNMDEIYAAQGQSSDYIANQPGSNTLSIPTSFSAGDTLTLNTTGTRNTGSIIRLTIPTKMTIQIEAWGAGGSVGNTYSSVTQPAGKGAYLKTNDITIEAGTELLILIGQKGDISPAAYNGDGSGRWWRWWNIYIQNRI